MTTAVCDGGCAIQSLVFAAVVVELMAMVATVRFGVMVGLVTL